MHSVCSNLSLFGQLEFSTGGGDDFTFTTVDFCVIVCCTSSIVRLSIKRCVVCQGDGGTEIVLRDDESPLSIYSEHPKHCVR